MTENRRKDERFQLRIPVRWDGMTGWHEARLEDISLGGCFVDTAGRVELKQVISLDILLPSGTWLPLKGEVTSYQPGIGFGIAFSFLTEDEVEVLRKLILGNC